MKPVSVHSGRQLTFYVEVTAVNSCSSVLPRAKSYLLARCVVPMVLSAGMVCAPGLSAAAADPKIADDLAKVIVAPGLLNHNWAKDIAGKRYVKVLLVGNGDDPEVVSLRAAVLAAGGSVYMHFVSAPVLSVMLPSNQVGAIANRSDVQGISPNRLTARTSSNLESSIGALTNGVRNYSGIFGTYTGLDG